MCKIIGTVPRIILTWKLLNWLDLVLWQYDFRSNPPLLPLLTILNSTVSAVEPFRFLGSTISRDLKWASDTKTIRKKAPKRLCAPALELQPSSGSSCSTHPSSPPFSLLPSACGSDRPRHRTGTDHMGSSGLQREQLAPAWPPSCTCEPPEWGNGQERLLQTLHTLDTNCSMSSPLLGAIEPRMPKPPDPFPTGLLPIEQFIYILYVVSEGQKRSKSMKLIFWFWRAGLWLLIPAVDTHATNIQMQPWFCTARGCGWKPSAQCCAQRSTL